MWENIVLLLRPVTVRAGFPSISRLTHVLSRCPPPPTNRLTKPRSMAKAGLVSVPVGPSEWASSSPRHWLWLLTKNW
ncbi:MAG: hypothetical protein R3F11_15055 [Verrucomicrobiales bacterium]